MLLRSFNSTQLRRNTNKHSSQSWHDQNPAWGFKSTGIWRCVFGCVFAEV